MNTRCPPKRVPSAARFFTLCRLTVQPPQSYSVGGQRSSRQLTGKPAGTRPDYRGRWCAGDAKLLASRMRNTLSSDKLQNGLCAAGVWTILIRRLGVQIPGLADG
ncbi:UNVERIFIED_CONTAM: hypothetical protein FKN15_056386 [Acipenser sinensis]